MNLKTEYLNFLKQNFNGLELKKPLFYNWNSGLRFDLQKEFTNPVDPDNHVYFKKVYHRANSLLEFCFEQNDKIYLAVFSYKWKKQRIKKSNYIFTLMKSDPQTEIAFDKVKNRYEKDEKWNRLIIKQNTSNLDTKSLTIGLCNTDFPTMRPHIREEVYLINVDKKLIFHIYDDRGLDILAADKKTLNQLYDRFDKWILEYDREKIKAQLNR